MALTRTPLAAGATRSVRFAVRTSAATVIDPVPDAWELPIETTG